MSTFSRIAFQIPRHSALQKVRFSQPIIRSIQTHTISYSRRKRAIALLAKGIKIVRIPFIILSVFGLGYNQGIMEYAKDPEKMKLKFLQQIVTDFGCQDLSLVLLAAEGDANTHFPFGNEFVGDAPKREQLRKVVYVGERIVTAARAYVHEKVKEVAANHDPDENIEKNEEYMKWNEAWDRIGGNIKWVFVLVESPVPNACVSELLPRTIFVSTSLLNTFTTNDDELGMVLGHEVSHLIHGHSSEKNSVETMLKTFEVLLLSLDPTQGVLSIGIVGAISALHNFLSLSYSRHHELEADELGIELAARACFDTKVAALTFKRMHDHDVETQRELYGAASTDRRPTSFMSSHPASIERFENMTQASIEENPEKYPTDCAKVRNGFFNLYSRSN